MLLDQAQESIAVGGFLPGRYHGTSADRQRQQQLQHRDVERQRRDGEQHVVDGKTRRLLHAQEEIDHVPVLQRDTLGPPGRTRRVEHIDEILAGAHAHGRRARQLGRLGKRDPIKVDNVDALEGRARIEPGMGQHEPQPGILGHVAQPLGREIRIERNVCRAGTQDGKQRDNHVERPVKVQPDQCTRADALAPQVFGQARRAARQLAVGQFLVVADGRDRVGRRECLLPDKIVHMTIDRHEVDFDFS